MPYFDHETYRSECLARLRLYAEDRQLPGDIAALYRKFLIHTDSLDVPNTVELINRVENLRLHDEDFQFPLLDSMPGAVLFDKDQSLRALRTLKMAFQIDDENYEYGGQENMDAYAELHPLAYAAKDKLDVAQLVASEDYETLSKLVDIATYAADAVQKQAIKGDILPDDKTKPMMPDEIRILSRERKGVRDTTYEQLRADQRCLDVFPKFDLEEGYIRMTGEGAVDGYSSIYSKPVIRDVNADKNRIELVFLEEKDAGRHVNYVTMALPLDTAIGMMEERMRENADLLDALSHDPSLRGQFQKAQRAEKERQGWERVRDIMRNVARVSLRDPKADRGAPGLR